MENTNPLVITRIFDAPRELVWKAWTDPKLYMKWWGPKDYTSPVCQIDLTIGGKLLYCMQGADGQRFYGIGRYTEIVEPERLSYTDSFADENGNVVPSTYYGMPEMPLETKVVIIFVKLEDGKTKTTLTHEGLPQGNMSEMTSAGWNESFDKLDEALKA